MYLLSVWLTACSTDSDTKLDIYTVQVEVSGVNLSTSTLKPGENVNVEFVLNNSTAYPVVVSDARIVLENMYKNTFHVLREHVITDCEIESGNQSEVIKIEDLNIEEECGEAPDYCRILLDSRFVGGGKAQQEIAGIRLLDDNTLVTYRIDKESYQGIPIYQQTGDMSAAFAVTKTLTGWCGGMAGTMNYRPQIGGTYPVYATPQFLVESVRYTVDMYDRELGADTEIETVVLGTGLSSVSHLSSALKAVFLPVHFLVSVNSTREVKDIMDYSMEQGYPCYATLGYDASVPQVGVAWVKLLDLPSEYKEFMLKHKVKNVVLFGVSEGVTAETLARKCLVDASTPDTGYEPGSLFIQYTNYGSVQDIAAIRGRVYDYDDLTLGKEHHIADWESGLVQAQIDGLANSIKSGTQASVTLLTSTTDQNLSLYNVASFAMLECMSVNGCRPKGVILDEYLTCHPYYEMSRGYLPMLYWQMNPAESTVARLDVLQKGILEMFPDVNTEAFTADYRYYLNSNYNRFGLRDALLARGIKSENISIRKTEDAWNPADDAEQEEYMGVWNYKISAVEEFTYDIVANEGAAGYRNWIQELQPIGMEGLYRMANLMNSLGMDVQVSSL